MKKIVFGLKVVCSVALFLKSVALEIKSAHGRLPENIPGQISKISSHPDSDEGKSPHLNQLKQKQIT